MVNAVARWKQDFRFPLVRQQLLKLSFIFRYFTRMTYIWSYLFIYAILFLYEKKVAESMYGFQRDFDVWNSERFHLDSDRTYTFLWGQNNFIINLRSIDNPVASGNDLEAVAHFFYNLCFFSVSVCSIIEIPLRCCLASEQQPALYSDSITWFTQIRFFLNE